MIVFVAPYSPVALSQNPHLGAARKIESLLEMLSTRFDVLLINTAHNGLGDLDVKQSELILNGRIIKVLTLPEFANRKIGKFLNLLQLSRIVEDVLGQFNPKLIWIYNLYATELVLARKLQSKCFAPVVLEFEDSVFSRRKFDIKCLVDWLSFKFYSPKISHAFCVNSSLKSVISSRVNSISLLPGLVNFLPDENMPFSHDGPIRVGYFGGLSLEKGGELICQLAEMAGEKYHFFITGSGGVDQRIKDISNRNSAVHFYGLVSEGRLAELQRHVDVIINPHSDIDKMGNGVFPFKVMEAVARGKVLVSTKLPDDGLKIYLKGVCYTEPSAHDFYSMICNSKIYFMENSSSIKSAADLVCKDFSPDFVLNMVELLVEENGQRF